MGYERRRQPFLRPPGLDGPETRKPVAIIGAGPVGLALAVDLAQRGVGCVLLDDNDTVSVGSRAICWAKRTLEIFTRLGVGRRMLDKGVTWQVGRLFHGDREVYAFDLLPEPGHECPAFINLQQYYVEDYLIDRARDFPGLIDLRFRNEVVAHEDRGDHVALQIRTPDGTYALEADYLVACDGARSPTRARMGLPFEGERFDEQFLIADVELSGSPFPQDRPERWFWFRPPFHDGQSALLHRQPDDIYRIDLQLGPEADGREEAREQRVMPRLRAILGDRPFRLDWTSVYRFRCARLARFVHGRVIFCGDSAHLVSPFGARGGNGGVQDADNLGWKLAALLSGQGGPGLLDSYDAERGAAADENILNSSRATRFMTPRSATEARYRDALLALAGQHEWARPLINSGRLSTPCTYPGDPGGGRVAVGAPAVDVPVGEGRWLLSSLPPGFVLLGIGGAALPSVPGVTAVRLGAGGDLDDPQGMAARWGHGAYLLRPDGHVAGWWQRPGAEEVAAARDAALGHAGQEVTA